MEKGVLHAEYNFGIKFSLWLLAIINLMFIIIALLDWQDISLQLEFRGCKTGMGFMVWAADGSSLSVELSLTYEWTIVDGNLRRILDSSGAFMTRGPDMTATKL
ncbi:predicted protein [Sclerotinia sclerotiorum 1980 UF-70]|uniref:Uncharacterized protein n=1 Tax=Sclerotinia sclerotiorum (strain ATCC 18683 / 1980 / Ss-1) TaxID=665079 RepID=A7ENG1_SCLS1|nr:predicted protein [Sclerotinia sclerotiorum 1980 UF-70]EDO04377.1 predicted protein [Sclerotinia sclerotiorum 1980 UF-70]